MLTLRAGQDRGHFEHGWLDTYHTFSFGDYMDPRHMGFRSLRVLNEDWVGPGQGFPRHGHRDMEILTWVLEGALEHRDSLGNGSIIRPGELQRMSAGTGILHSEANPSSTEPVHLLQIWILPDRRGHEPSYDQRAYNLDESKGRWRVVASNDGRDESLVIHQDARLSMARVEPGQILPVPLEAGRYAWLQVARGSIELGNLIAKAGDGVAVSDTTAFEIKATAPSELLLFDMS